MVISNFNIEPIANVKLLRNKRKNKEVKSQKKTNSNEDRKIKRMQTQMKSDNIPIKCLIKKEESLYDLWESNSKSTAIIKLEPSKYPKVIIPHPGQSYNPNKEDLKNLLQTIVDNNKSKIKEEVKTSILDLENYKFVHPEVKEEDREDQKVSNNPPINDSDRLPRRVRNKLVK